MGRGDIKTKKGKRFAGSYGKKRLKKAETEKFIAKAESCYYDAMNEYHILYEQLKKQRSVEKIMNND